MKEKRALAKKKKRRKKKNCPVEMAGEVFVKK